MASPEQLGEGFWELAVGLPPAAERERLRVKREREERAAAAWDRLLPEAVRVVAELLEDEDSGVRLRAAEAVLSRRLPKLSAMVVQEVGRPGESDPGSELLRAEVLRLVRERPA